MLSNENNFPEEKTKEIDQEEGNMNNGETGGSGTEKVEKHSSTTVSTDGKPETKTETVTETKSKQ